MIHDFKIWYLGMSAIISCMMYPPDIVRNALYILQCNLIIIHMILTYDKLVFDIMWFIGVTSWWLYQGKGHVLCVTYHIWINAFDQGGSFVENKTSMGTSGWVPPDVGQKWTHMLENIGYRNSLTDDDNETLTECTQKQNYGRLKFWSRCSVWTPVKWISSI